MPWHQHHLNILIYASFEFVFTPFFRSRGRAYRISFHFPNYENESGSGVNKPEIKEARDENEKRKKAHSYDSKTWIGKKNSIILSLLWFNIKLAKIFEIQTTLWHTKADSWLILPNSERKTRTCVIVFHFTIESFIKIPHILLLRQTITLSFEQSKLNWKVPAGKIVTLANGIHVLKSQLYR